MSDDYILFKRDYNDDGIPPESYRYNIISTEVLDNEHIYLTVVNKISDSQVNKGNLCMKVINRPERLLCWIDSQMRGDVMDSGDTCKKLFEEILNDIKSDFKLCYKPKAI